MSEMQHSSKNDEIETRSEANGNENATSDNELNLLHLSRLLPPDFAETAHKFEPTTFESPQKCHMCNVTITGGMWNNKQGLQCKDCGVILGVGHDQCHSDAMITKCSKALTEPETSNLKEETSSSRSVGVLTKMVSRRRQSSVYDRPHKFVPHTYASPTYCAVCQGLLVGLWSQGLQCQVCRLNIHRGEGRDHDDCRLEALLWPCNGEPIEEDDVMTLREAMALSPNFIKDVTDQLGKDLHSHAKEVVVNAGVEEERSKKLRRLRKTIIATIEKLDTLEESGELYCIYLLLRLHLIFAGIMLMIGIVVFRLALCPKMGLSLGNAHAFRLTLASELTASFTVRLHLMVLSLGIRYGALLFLRKSIMVDRFLVDVFGIHAEQDLGITVAGAARRTRAWSDRLVIATGLACCIVILLWIPCQPSVEDSGILERSVLPESSGTEASVEVDL